MECPEPRTNLFDHYNTELIYNTYGSRHEKCYFRRISIIFQPDP